MYLPRLVIQTTEQRWSVMYAPSPKGNFSAIRKKIFRIKLEYFSSTKFLMPIVRIYGLKQEGGELFIKYFRKL